ncbi:MAG: hypothetical protein RIS08_716 [Actinomycetota bacterium]|jgi:cytochrome b involved in lipid metabolism
MKTLLALFATSTLLLAGCSSPAQEVEPTQPVTTSVTQAPDESAQEENVEASDTAEPEVTESSVVAEPTAEPEAQPAETSTPKASATKTPAPTKAPTKTPIPTPSETASTAGYTKAQVAEKSTRSNCWVIVNESVYNLTDWINKHPGGSGSIASLCGQDATSAFEGKHGGEARPSSILESYYLGPLRN